MFSCFARDLSKVSARSVPELESSITKSFSGVKVAWLRSVVNYWAARASRWIPAVALSQCYSFELTLRDARPVMRTKDEMSQEEWLPLGGLQFAKPVLGPRVQSVAPTAFSFVVAAVHPVDSLRTHVASDEPRLRLQRSAVRFPEEAPGAAYEWWLNFLSEEEARAEAMCPVCREIRVELASIVIRQQKSKNLEVKAANKDKTTRRSELLEQLEAHECTDRAQGKLAVPQQHSRTLSTLATAAALPAQLPAVQEHKQARAVDLDEEAAEDPASESDSLSDVSADEESYMDRTVKPANLPKAFKDRGNRITKGMVVAVACAAGQGEYMGGQPFWLAKVVRLTQHHITLWYYGDKFLEVYAPLFNQDKTKHCFTWRHDEITMLHWNISLVSQASGGRGRLSAADQRVLSMDVRVPWQLPGADCKTSSTRKRRASCAGTPPAKKRGRPPKP
jgi:hypothetical protein